MVALDGVINCTLRRFPTPASPAWSVLSRGGSPPALCHLPLAPIDRPRPCPLGEGTAPRRGARIRLPARPAARGLPPEPLAQKALGISDRNDAYL
jgi:hypothetical protein